MDQPPPPPKPHRGAPRGNKNALKHGFYTRHFDKVDLADLKAVSFDGLNDEITMLRVFIRRLIERYQSSDDLDSALAVVRALSIASFSLARLVIFNIPWRRLLQMSFARPLNRCSLQ
jgi:hypothetical protein